jgi:hypothetical protein
MAFNNFIALPKPKKSLGGVYSIFLEVTIIVAVRQLKLKPGALKSPNRITRKLCPEFYCQGKSNGLTKLTIWR